MSLPHRTRHRLAIAVATVCAGIALANAAEAVDLRDWGRKFPANERFVVLAQFSNLAVLDKETQLVWQAVPTDLKQTWLQAYLACHNVTSGGRRGWRLPTYPEIASVVQTDGAKPAAFNGVPNDVYWTATVYPDANFADSYAAVINVPNGNPGMFLKNNQLRFWCVRGPA